MSTAIKELQQEGLSVMEACRVSGVGRNSIYGALKSGDLPGRKLGRRVLIKRTDLIAFIDRLPLFPAKAA